MTRHRDSERNSGNSGAISILVGLSCPLSCAHCSVRLSTAKKSLTEKEIKLLRKTVREMSPKEITFSGGEPALYIATMNRITAAHPEPAKLSVRITTSGYFAENAGRAAEVLRSIKNLKHVQMSYDRFHQKFVPIGHLRSLYSACRELGITFRVIMVLESALDLAFSAKIREVGPISVSAMKITDAGAAKVNGLAFKYPGFDPAVWRKTCQKRGRISYICGKGFTLCCSYHTVEANWKKFVHPSMEAHRASLFYSLVSSKTLGGIKKFFKLDDLKLEPKHTHECTLCGYIFDEAVRLGRFKG